jgi:hypothetical protein
VDLLVTGLPPQRLFEAAAAAERLLPMADIDLVPIELARPEVVARAEYEGRLLYRGPPATADDLAS